MPNWRIALRSLAIVCVALGLVLARGGGLAQDAPAAEASGPVHVIPLTGVIGPASAAFVTRSIDAAQDAGAAVLIIEMDTPGGLVDAMRDINLAILAARIPVVVYVSPSGARATSAGAYILYASHIAAMAPGTTIGAATPVELGPMPTTPGEPADPAGDEEEQAAPSAPASDQAMRNKVVNDSVSTIRSLAELRGRNADWAESAVRDGVSITATQALELSVADLLADDRDALIAALDGREVAMPGGATLTLALADAEIVRVEPNFADRLLSVITNPNIAFLLINIGFIGLLASFYNGLEPVTLVAGMICLIVGFYGLNTLPVNYAGAALILLGLGMLVAEAFIVSYGILAIAGVAVFAMGSLMLVDSDVPALRIDWRLILVTAAGLGGAVVLVLGYGIAAQGRRISAGRESLIGMRGRVLDWSGEAGFVHVDGERWSARSADTLAAGDIVAVTAVTGLTLTVEASSETDTHTPSPVRKRGTP